MRAILIRVGADGTDRGGNWIAPVDPDSGRFVYIPIPENTVAFHPGCERRFDEVADPLFGFLAEHGANARYWRTRMDAKRGQPMHLDPDYEHLTYGDLGDVRGRDLRDFKPDDLMVFYSAFKPIRPADDLVYAVVGVYVVDEIVFAPAVEEARRGENAHTRKADRAPRDIVVRARPHDPGLAHAARPNLVRDPRLARSRPGAWVTDSAAARGSSPRVVRRWLHRWDSAGLRSGFSLAFGWLRGWQFPGAPLGAASVIARHSLGDSLAIRWAFDGVLMDFRWTAHGRNGVQRWPNAG